MIGAVSLDGWRTLVTIDSATDTDVFLAFTEKQLVPNLRPGDIVVMDKLSAHKSPKVITAIEAAQAQVLFRRATPLGRPPNVQRAPTDQESQLMNGGFDEGLVCDRPATASRNAPKELKCSRIIRWSPESASDRA